jgi:hypothetical protein
VLTDENGLEENVCDEEDLIVFVDPDDVTTGLLCIEDVLVANLLDEENNGMVSEELLFVTTLRELDVTDGIVSTEEVRVVMVLDVISGLVFEVTTRRVLSDLGGMDPVFLTSTCLLEVDTCGADSSERVVTVRDVTPDVDCVFLKSASLPPFMVIRFPDFVLSVPYKEFLEPSMVRVYVFWTTVLV